MLKQKKNKANKVSRKNSYVELTLVAAKKQEPIISEETGGRGVTV
jgi:hypothetical protein